MKNSKASRSWPDGSLTPLEEVKSHREHIFRVSHFKTTIYRVRLGILCHKCSEGGGFKKPAAQSMRRKEEEKGAPSCCDDATTPVVVVRGGGCGGFPPSSFSFLFSSFFFFFGGGGCCWWLASSSPSSSSCSAGVFIKYEGRWLVVAPKKVRTDARTHARDGQDK